MMIAIIHTSVLICVEYHSVSHVQYITSHLDQVDFAKNFFHAHICFVETFCGAL